MKQCSKCKENLPRDRFYYDKSRKDGLRHICTRCLLLGQKRKRENAEYSKRRNATECERVYRRKTLETQEELAARRLKKRRLALKIKYGISIEQYDELLKSQGGVCAICGLPETTIDTRYNTLRSLAVDHCHATGIVRGLLCNSCNPMLGNSKDDIEILTKAINYLRKTNNE